MLITHDVSLAAGISNRILLMENGRILTEATRNDFSKIISRLDASTEM
jgi:ABC-type dipeptide/oligopeptide/nickel transport system ATPase component